MVVYGTEYFFGAGIQQTPAGTAPYGTPLKVIDLGVTHVPKDVFQMYLDEISPRYTQETYSLLSHNCNNFSSEVAQFLVGVSIPDYILNLPNEVMSSPMGALISKFLKLFMLMMHLSFYGFFILHMKFGMDDSAYDTEFGDHIEGRCCPTSTSV